MYSFSCFYGPEFKVHEVFDQLSTRLRYVVGAVRRIISSFPVLFALPRSFASSGEVSPVEQLFIVVQGLSERLLCLGKLCGVGMPRLP